jgi:hypothetical protein
MSIRPGAKPGGSQVAALPAPPGLPDFGYNGGFGVDTLNPITNPSGPVMWEERYVLTSGGGDVTSVDNAYMAWSTSTPNTLTVKQPGWYVVSGEMDFSAPLAAAGQFDISGPTFPIPAGASAMNLRVVGLIYVTEGSTLNLNVTLTGELSYVALILTPLFTLA